MEKYLIWSNEHEQWWRAEGLGYTGIVDEAGRYSRADAERIVDDATACGQLTSQLTDPCTGEEYSCVTEVMLLASESIAEIGRLREARDRYVADVAHLREQLRDANLTVVDLEETIGGIEEAVGR